MTWISIEERLPADEHCVLIHVKHEGYYVAYIRNGMWYVNNSQGKIGFIRHRTDIHTICWMELPPPPINEELTEPQEFIVKHQQELKEKLIATNEEAERVALKFLETNRELIRRLSDK